jgi:electron transport complex protein RnfG
MKNTLLNMVLVLGGISLLASAGVGYVYKITEEPIAAAKAENDRAALRDVLPPFEENRADTLTLDGLEIVVNTATNGGEVVGYAVKTITKNGFSGEFSLMVGFAPDGKVLNVKVLEHAETPGLGSKMADAGNPLLACLEGRNPAEMKLAVTKDGGDVDALTAATITSRAYVDAVARAFNAVMQQTGGTQADAASGATSEATRNGPNGPNGPNGLIDSPVQGEVKIIEGKEAGNE